MDATNDTSHPRLLIPVSCCPPKAEWQNTHVAWEGVHEIVATERALNRDLAKAISSSEFRRRIEHQEAACPQLMPPAIFEKWRNHTVSRRRSKRDTAPATMDIRDQAQNSLTWLQRMRDWGPTFQGANQYRVTYRRSKRHYKRPDGLRQPLGRFYVAAKSCSAQIVPKDLRHLLYGPCAEVDMENAMPRALVQFALSEIKRFAESVEEDGSSPLFEKEYPYLQTVADRNWLQTYAPSCMLSHKGGSAANLIQRLRN